MCDIAPMLYTTKRCAMATLTCYMPCYMPCYERGRKSCTNQDVFLGPFVSGWRVASSAMHLPLIRCCGQTVVLRTEPTTAGGLQRPCAQLDAQSGLQPRCSKHSVVAGRATAIAADSRSLHRWRSAQ